MINKSSLAGLTIAIAAGLALSWWMRTGPATRPANDIRIPAEISNIARAGEQLFNENCSVCHGKNAAGTDRGPRLVHKIYEPNHHRDSAFFRAAQYGARQHHWTFGNMPAITAVQQEDVAKIIAYVRTLQRANGIN